jgi:glucose-6-phosphate isomerase
LVHGYYSQDISTASASLDAISYQRYLTLADEALASLKAHYIAKEIKLLDLALKTSDLEEIEPIAERFCESFDDVIILGVGGSSLGGRTICELAAPAGSSRPTLHFMDNIDSNSFDRLFLSVTPARTGFIVISKSGGTAETLTQFLYCLDIFRPHLDNTKLADHFVVITEPGDRPLRRLAEKWNLDIIDHDPDVGGRYSALSIVGLLPALISGVDAYQVRDGAAVVLQQMMSASTAKDCPPAVGAVLNVALARENNINSTVLMPYLDRLARFGDWFRQLWAESLGKNGEGSTPIWALGAVDQHSQLQLFLHGPKDKFFTLILADQGKKGRCIPEDLTDDPELKFIFGKSMGDLMVAEQQATAATLIKNNCPTRIIRIKTLDEQTLGALMMHFMLETIIAADLMRVNAFDQPAVEEGKVLAKKYLSGEAN